MRKFAACGFALLVMLMIALGAFTITADATSECVPSVQSVVEETVCGGEVVDTVTLPQATVTEQIVRTITDTVTKTVRVPGPTITAPGATVTVPGPTVTMGPPAPRTTVFRPGETVTVFVPNEDVTETTTATTGPFTQPPETRFSQPSRRPGQSRPDHGTMEPDGPTPFTIDFGDGDFTTAEAAIGLATLVALVALLLAGMYMGYYLGYKDSEEKDTNFMRALLDETKLRRGKHS